MGMAHISLHAFTVWRGVLPLRFRFRHHLADRGSVETVLLAAESAAGAVGYGQALPRGYLTGETIDSCMSDLLERWLPGMRRRRWDAGGGGIGMLDAFADLHLAADRERRLASYAAAESAAVDALLRTAALPGAACWGGPASARPLVASLPATQPAKAAWMARILRRFGYRRFKVKVGLDGEADAARLLAVRRAVGSGAWLAVDANAAWSAEEALRRIDSLKRFAVSLVEEPLRPDAGATLGEIERLTGSAVMADESLCSLADAERLLAQGSPSWWNLRFAKNGGFSGVRALSGLARDNGVALYGGVLVGETSCLAAAGRLGMGLADFRCMEYGFPRLLLRGDPFRGGPGGFFGTAEPMVRPGLGVRLLDHKMASFDRTSL